MAQPRAAAAPETAPSAQDALLATKLHLPRPQPGVVPRPRLAQQLDEGLGRGLVLVCAPAGYGKTVLLAEWAEDGRQPAAWLSLDGGDNDPARFWRHVIAALDRVRPGIGGAGRTAARPPGAAGVRRTGDCPDQRAGRARPEHVRLVLDDYHVISAQPVHTSLEFLLEHRPPGLRPGAGQPQPTRPCPWPGCGPGGSWPSCVRPTCASPRARPRRCCSR